MEWIILTYWHSHDFNTDDLRLGRIGGQIDYSHSNQCSTTGATKAVGCTTLERLAHEVAAVGFAFHTSGP